MTRETGATWDELHCLVRTAAADLHANDAPPGGEAEAVVVQGRWWNEQRRRLRLVRWLVIAGSASYVAVLAWGFFEIVRNGPVSEANATQMWHEIGIAIGLPVVLTALGLILAHRPSFGAQLCSRAIFWGFVLSVAVCQWMLLDIVGSGMHQPALVPFEATAGLIAMVTCVGVLVVLGDHGLRKPCQRTFRPAAFHGLLALSLVMGVADALLLFVFGTQLLQTPAYNPAAVLLSVWLLVSAYGLYRLRIWGLAAMAAGNLAEILLVLAGALDPIEPFYWAVMLTALVQVLLPVPVYGAILRGQRTNGRRSRFERVPAIVLLALASLGIALWAWTLAIC